MNTIEYGENLVSFESERDSMESIREQQTLIKTIRGLDLFNELPVSIVICNARRQIVYSNGAALKIFHPENSEPYGLRLGEALGCIHSSDGDGGCGTGFFCRFCGAAKSMAGSLSGYENTQLCRLERSSMSRNEQLDLQVWTKPISLGNSDFLLCVLIDVTSEGRREAFEKIFLHDLMNTASSLSSLLTLIESRDPVFMEYLDLAKHAAEQLTDEIMAHRVLNDAERGVLFIRYEVVLFKDLLQTLIKTYHYIAEPRGITIKDETEDLGSIVSDTVLIKRVLSNLIKNAVEASKRGACVSLKGKKIGQGLVQLSIHNPEVMSDAVRAQLFKRSFSTKGKGRGLGTYSARLFTEDYLQGSIYCSSKEGEGTVFILQFPSLSEPVSEGNDNSLI